MASFVVETYVPQGDQDRFAADVDGMRAAAEVVVVVAGKVHHIRSYLVPGDEMGFHVIEADTAEDVVRVAELAGIEVERVVEAIGVGPGRAVEDGTEEGSSIKRILPAQLTPRPPTSTTGDRSHK